MTAAEIADASGGVVHGDNQRIASAFGIDSRILEPESCFFALRDQRDGYDFVPDAFARGAVMAVVDSRGPTTLAERPLVVVGEPLAALASSARVARARLEGTVVIGITGSAGKTATKDLTAAALRRSKRVYASPSSFNNEAGLPLTLLGAPEDADVLVTEMGARFAGNVAELAELAQPQIGVVTHVGLAHAEHLGGRAGIARVKGELLEVLPPDGLAVLNADCDATPGLARRTKAQVITVGRGEDADVRVSAVTLDHELRPTFTLTTPWGSGSVELSLRGEHQVENAAMAATVALSLDTPLNDVLSGLAEASTAARRMELVHTGDGVTVINDAYNSSPTSAAAAVRSLARLPVDGRRVAVLGEMLELGADAESEHRAIGALAGAAGIDLVIVVGAGASGYADGVRGTHAELRAVDDVAGVARLVREIVRPGDAVLVKASRAIGLERVADELVAGRTG